jgi:hypothetical protein
MGSFPPSGSDAAEMTQIRVWQETAVGQEMCNSLSGSSQKNAHFMPESPLMKSQFDFQADIPAARLRIGRHLRNPFYPSASYDFS